MTKTPHRATPLVMARSVPPAPVAARAAAHAPTLGAVQVAWRFEACPWAAADVWACVIETETEIRTLGGVAESQPSDEVGARLARVGYVSAESVLPEIRSVLDETGSDHLIVRVNNPWLRMALTDLAGSWGQAAATIVAFDDSPAGTGWRRLRGRASVSTSTRSRLSGSSTGDRWSSRPTGLPAALPGSPLPRGSARRATSARGTSGTGHRSSPS